MSSPYAVLDNRPIDQWKVTELKEELKRRKLITRGLKEDLVKRLDEAIRNETEDTKGNEKEGVDNGFDGIPPTKDETGEVVSISVGAEMAKDMDVGDSRKEVDEGMVQIDDSTEALGIGKFQEGGIMGCTDPASNEELVVYTTSIETSATVTPSAVPEIASNVQESQSNETLSEGNGTLNESKETQNESNENQNESGDLKPHLENEVPRPTPEDVELNSSDPNNQVSEVSPVLGFQVKSDSISTDCVSNNEKNELKDNIIADNVKLELHVKPGMVQPSPNNIVPDGGVLHPMDVEEPPEEKVSVEEIYESNVANSEISKKNDSADVGSSEKLNLDRSSGDDSMEEDAMDSKQIDSKYNSDDVRENSEKSEVTVVKDEGPVDAMLDDTPADKRDVSVEDIKAAPAASTVKRKLHDQEAVGNNETSKRQRRWHAESHKITEPQSNNLASSTTPKDALPTTLKRSFSRSDSAVSENAPKERVVPPSPKTPTNSLRIDRFLRPFTLKAVQELLGKTGTITSFWMDHIKTHCYVTYSSVEEATETRNAVYNLQWPSNGGRLLAAEFVDPQEVKTRAEAPPQSPITPVSTGPIFPPAPTALQPQPSPRAQPSPRPQPSPRQQVQVQRQQLPPPPPLPLPPPPPLSDPPQVRERLPLPPPPPLPEKVDPPIVTLDDLFRKTKATPRIYYLPLSDEQVAAKLKAAEKTSKQ